ncbi:putative outer membrane starch-binding protein [Sphingobacterium allocomposti]|uniref:Putative outer membrane starch-binding protein n=1 Tax=Sphingobacterium allocomposti TaxID=415956 RepID=A0A5S5DIV9_9SPHI|nr:RagB/SusD family nutrient uptake outer membrane protein [Sphingobacterium composti Yoo et al. 2007 non Ten et al. 2007]TYP95867.1 putative outer membrane starch-binding protein [Sphingobacterium composti Yoo et al. 2007 non Ten et al. 2007]
MKKNLYNRLRKGFLVILSTTFLLSCNNDDFFILPDRGGLDAEGLWNTEGAVNFHLNKAYELIIPRFPWQTVPSRFDIHLVSDEHFFASNGSYGAQALGIAGNALINHDVRYVGNSYNQNYLDNRYMDIARCNNAIKYLPESTIPDAQKFPLLGQYYALRAMVYLELVKVYGGVPLVLEPQDPDAVMTDGRSSARACFAQIVDDLDYAMQYLEGVTWGGDNWGRITHAAAAALKGKALLYWASPQFNPLDDPKHPYDVSRWQEALAANKEAYDIGLAAGKRLVENYADIFRIKGSANTETLISRPYSSTRQRRGHDEERRSRPRSENQNAAPHNGYRATVKLLRAYPMKDGNRIDEPGNYTYDDVLFWKDRDPRFEATMAYNGSIWVLSNKQGRRQWNYEGATNNGRAESANWAVYCKKFSTPTLAEAAVPYSDGIGGSGMDWIEMRFAEVMLNLADCANETGDMATAKDMVRRIRQRAGIEQGSNDYGLGHIASIAQMRELLLNERMVEFAFENKRTSDLRRTRNWHKLTGEFLEVYQVQVAGETDADRTAKINELEAIDPNTGRPFRDGLDLNNRDVYLEYFKPHYIVPQQTGFRAMNIPEYHNFYTFHNDFVRRGVNIETTIGWEGGTFDPLDD